MLSWGDSEVVARGRHVVPPRSQRAGGYSAAEMRQAAHALQAWRAANPVADAPGPGDGWHGHLLGVEAFVELDASLRAELARSHPYRLKLLDRVQNLPFDLHHEVIRLALSRPSELLVATSDSFDVGVSKNEPDQAAIVADLAATLGVLKLLALLGLSAGRRFPAASMLTLLYVLILLQTVRSASQTVPSASPSTRITRPPGQLVITEPRMPRAPGCPVSLAVHHSRGCGGLCAPRGSAVVT